MCCKVIVSKSWYLGLIFVISLGSLIGCTSRDIVSEEMSSRKETTKYEIENIQLDPIFRIGEQDFDYYVIDSPYSGGSIFGYSIACLPALPNSKDIPGALISSYEANNQTGSVHLIDSHSITNCTQHQCQDIVTINGIQEELPPVDNIKNLAKNILGRPQSVPMSWFGHEVDLKDVDGDGLPEALIGARFAKNGNGAVYFISGTELSRVLRENKQVDLRDIKHTEFVSEDPDTNELGFSVSLMPFHNNNIGKLIIRRSSGPKGEFQAGSVAILDSPQEVGTVNIPNSDFFSTDPVEIGQDFGRTITTVSIANKQSLLLGSYANPAYYNIPDVSGKTWAIDLNQKDINVIPVYEIDQYFNGQSESHLMVSALSLGKKMYHVIGQTIPGDNKQTSSHLIIKQPEEKKIYAFSNEILNGSNFAWSLSTEVDINNDSYRDIVLGASGFSPPEDGMGRGAIVLVDGKKLSNLLEQAPDLERVLEVNILLFPLKELQGIGSKRRQCITQDKKGNTKIIVGAIYGRGEVVIIQLPRQW